MITRRSGNALFLDGSEPRVPDEEPRNSRVISYSTEGRRTTHQRAVLSGQ